LFFVLCSKKIYLCSLFFALCSKKKSLCSLKKIIMKRIPNLNINITAPPSKSMTQRLIAAAIMARGKSTLINPSQSEDAMAARDIAKSLGATLIDYAKELHIIPHFQIKNTIINCGESGFCTRLFTPIASVEGTPFSVTGSGTLLNRTLKDMTDALKHFGVIINHSNNKLPMNISGQLTPAIAEIDGSSSSQTVSGLLMALPLLKESSDIMVLNPVSRPYIAMTIRTMRMFDVKVSNSNYKKFNIKGNQRYNPQRIEVEGDWSGAAYWLVVGAIGGSVKVKGLQDKSAQADKAIIYGLRRAGAEIFWENGIINVKRQKLRPFRINLKDCPDLFPPLTLLAAFCKGKTTIEGVKRLINKESNRAEALKDTFGKLGVRIVIDDNKMIIYGGNIHGGNVSSFSDHRIAMAATCAGIFTETPVVIDDTDCIKKSYPEFMNEFNLRFPNL
jgi:3-phosphoshikimate 1-carboxyvinyltransferase